MSMATEIHDKAMIVAAFTALAKAVSYSLHTNQKTLEALICLPTAINTGNDAELRDAVNIAIDHLSDSNATLDDALDAMKKLAAIDKTDVID